MRSLETHSPSVRRSTEIRVIQSFTAKNRETQGRETKLNEILDGLFKALQLIFSGDPRVIEITLRALYISGMASLIAVLWGIPIAILLALKDFRGKFLIKTMFNSLIGIPTVVLGLFLFLAFKGTGPLGILDLLYTPTAIIIGEAILVTPIVVSLATSAIEAVDPEIISLAQTLGASESQASIAVLKEALNGISLAGIACFNRAIAELGVAQMVGGNIAHATQVLTTYIANETNKGNIELAIALGIILLLLVFGINLTLYIVQRRRQWSTLWN
jgi:tungstate transport system permease protein